MALAETELARQAVDRKLITEQQLQECLRLQQALNRPASLAALLVRRGYLTENQCNALSSGSNSSQTHLADRHDSQINGLDVGDQALANRLVSSGTIQPDTLEACIRDRGVDAFGQPETLAKVLVRKQLVAPETLRLQLGSEAPAAPRPPTPTPASTDANGVTCQACGSSFRALAEHYGHTVPCPSCGAGLSVSASPPSTATGRTILAPTAGISPGPLAVEMIGVRNSPPGQAVPGHVRTGSPVPSSHTPAPGTRDGADAPGIHLRGPGAPPGSRPSEYPDPGRADLAGLTGNEFSDPAARDVIAAETVADLTDPIARVFGRRVGADGEVTTFGPYDVLGEIARGGMGIVYRARQRDLKRIVALKILKEGEEATERQIRRFKRETAAAAKLTHPNIVTVHEVGCHAGFHYFTMDLIEGQPLDQMVKEARPSKETHADGSPLQPGGLDVEWSLKVVEQVATAIHYAHSKKVIHRDLKPANILMDREGLPKVTDFGLAKDLDHKSLLTRTGAAVGTPFYMAPEQARGDDNIDQRIDVYALGVILYEMLTGTPPFKGSSTMEIYHRILEEEPRPLRLLNTKIPRDAQTICLKAIEKEPRRRYQTAQQLADDIKRYLTGEPITARPVGAVERLVKQARKNLPVVATVAVALLVLVPSLVAIVMQHIRTQRDDVDRLRTEALTRFGEAITESHLNAEAILATAEARLRDPAPDEALEEVDEVIAQLNSLDEILEEHLRATEEGILTRADFEKRLAEESQQTNTLYRSAHVVASAAEHEIGTEAALNRALERLEQALRFEDHPPAHHQMILIQLELGRADQALTYTDDLLTKVPNDHKTQRLRGRVLRHLGRHEEAVEALQVVVQRAADPLPARLELGDLLLLMGLPEDAKHEFENVLDQKNDDSFEGYLGRGRANSAMGYVLEALDDYNDAVDLQPLQARGYYHRGRLHLDEGRTGDAHKDFDIATSRDDRFYPAWLGLGVAQVRQLKWDDAMVSFQRITDSSDRTSRHLAAEAWYQLASLLRLRTDIGSAVQERIDARTADASINILELGGRLRNLGNQRQPSKEDQDEIAKDLTAPGALSVSLEEDLAVAQAAVDETMEKASAAYAKALELDPLMVEAPLGFAELLARRGRLAEARNALKVADDGQRHRRDLEEDGAGRGSQRADAPLRDQLHTGVRLAFLRAWIELEDGDARAARDEASLALDSPPPETFSDTETGRLFECMMSAVLGLAQWQLGESEQATRLLRRSMLLSQQTDQPLGKILKQAEKNAENTSRSKKVEYFSRARAFYTRVIDYCPLLAQAYLGRARLQASWPGYDSFAEKDFSKVIELAPLLPSAWIERGEVHIRLASAEPERLKLAEADFTRGIALLLEIEPRSLEANKRLANAYVGRAHTRRRLTDSAGAIEDARIASVLSPHDEAAYKLLVELHEQAREPVLALAARMEQAAIRAASRAEAQKFFKRGQVNQRRRSYPEAIDAFDKAIRLDPDHSEAFYERGVCYIKIGTFVPGILDLSRALELNPDLANVLYEKVYQISYVVDLDRLIDELNKIVKDHPDVAHVIFLRGYFYVAKSELRKPVNPSDIERGISDLEKTLELNSEHLAALVYRGMLYFKKGEIDRAMQDYERALSFHDKFSMAHYLKAQAHAARDERELMLYHLKLSFDNGFNGFERVKRDEVFAKYRRVQAFKQIVGD